MSRRTFLCTLALIALSATLAAAAEERPKIPRVGIVAATTPAASRNLVDAFREGLRELGYIDGRNILVEERYAAGKRERFDDLIAELVRLKMDVIAVSSAPGAVAAKSAATTTPVVFLAVTDPVGSGVVASLARPGGNLTGTSLVIGEELPGKWVELVRDVVPRASSVAALGHPDHPMTRSYVKGMEAAARALGLKLEVSYARDLAGLDKALSMIAETRVGALVVTASPFFGVYRKRISDFTLAHGIPTIGFYREFVVAGALLSYGPDFADSYRRGAAYVDKILKGAKPADLPVEQPTQFQLVINTKTAKALGIDIPRTILERADELIE